MSEITAITKAMDSKPMEIPRKTGIELLLLTLPPKFSKKV